MHIDEILSFLRASQKNEVTVPANWAQGRTVYGGLTAALIFDCMQREVLADKPDEMRPIRYLNLSFIGPLLTDEVLEIAVEMLRAGRSASQLVAKVIQNDRVCVVAQGCFGVQRQSKISITDKENHNMSPPRKANFLPQIPKVVPKFLRHFDMNLQAGRFPFMHSKKDYMHGWMRFKKAPSEFNDNHLIAAIDAWPCTVLQQLKLPAPASTMNWNLEFTQAAAPVKATDWVAYQAHTEHARDGYVFSDAKVWSQAGELLVLSRQTVGVFG